ncbi:MAG: GrpB family protein [Gemmatimonadales bacterium]
MSVLVVPHDPAWRRHFEAEARRLAESLGDVVVRLHHIGSTAVPGLPAKPVIDVLLEVGELEALDAVTPALEALGYEAKGEFGIPGRRYFRKDDASGQRTHQVHSFAVGSDNVRRHLAFRDYLIACPAVAQAYGQLKQALARRHPDDMERYRNGKDGFVKEQEAKAVAWWRIHDGMS